MPDQTGQYRDEHGRIIRGGKQPESIRRRISEGQRRRHERARALQGPRPNRKRCTQCGEWKSVNYEDRKASEFPIRNRTLASGEVAEYPAGECKECNKERAAEWRRRKREEGVLHELERKWNERRDPEHRRAYQRAYQAMKRRREGVPFRGGWKKYRDKGRGETVPREPFAEWISKTVGTNGGVSKLADKMGVDESLLRRVVTGAYVSKGKTREVKNVTVDLVDRALIAHGGDTLLMDLYPDLYA